MLAQSLNFKTHASANGWQSSAGVSQNRAKLPETRTGMVFRASSGGSTPESASDRHQPGKLPPVREHRPPEIPRHLSPLVNEASLEKNQIACPTRSLHSYRVVLLGPV